MNEFENIIAFVLKNKWTIIGIIVGLILGIMILLIGFWRVVLISFFVIMGAAVGLLIDYRKEIMKKVKKNDEE